MFRIHSKLASPLDELKMWMESLEKIAISELLWGVVDQAKYSRIVPPIYLPQIVAFPPPRPPLGRDAVL